MAITDKTRKLLWGRSGNRCAHCKMELSISATNSDDDSLVGDECHIISGQSNGPRFIADYPTPAIDYYDNLILLCRVHHKLFDDQVHKFGADNVRQIKTNHESWVSSKLAEQQKPLRARRLDKDIVLALPRLFNGGEVLAIMWNSCGFDFQYDELLTEDEVKLVGELAQNAKDYGELSDDLEPSHRVEAGFELTKTVRALESSGLRVFGKVDMCLLEGGVADHLVPFPISVLRILRTRAENTPD